MIKNIAGSSVLFIILSLSLYNKKHDDKKMTEVTQPHPRILIPEDEENSINETIESSYYDKKKYDR